MSREKCIAISILAVVLGIILMIGSSWAGDLWNNKNCPPCEVCEVCDECPMPPACPRCPSLKCPDVTCPAAPDCSCPAIPPCPDCSCPEQNNPQGAYHMFGMGLTGDPTLSIGLGTVSISKDGSCGLMHVCTTEGQCSGFVLKRVGEKIK